MILDPRTNLTLHQAYNFLSDLVDANMDNITELRDAIEKDYEVPDEVLDELEHKEQLTPNDIATLARAVGMDYELLTSKELPKDFEDRFNTSVNNLYAIRNKYKPKEACNADTTK